MKVVFCGTGWLPVVDAIRERVADDVVITVRDQQAPLIEQLRDANVILPSNCPIGREAIAAPENLQLIQQPAAGYDDYACVTACPVGAAFRTDPQTLLGKISGPLALRARKGHHQ